MKNYAVSSGAFLTWKYDELRRRSFMAHALGLIKRYVEAGFCTLIKKVDYDTYLSAGVRACWRWVLPVFIAESCVGIGRGISGTAEGLGIDEPTEHVVQKHLKKARAEPLLFKPPLKSTTAEARRVVGCQDFLPRN